MYSSWEAKLALLYKQAKAPVPPALQLPWYKDLPRAEWRQAAATAKLSQSILSPGGDVMSFTLPERTTPTLLIVSEFSAVLSFTSPGNSSTALAYWDLATRSVAYHSTDVPALPVCWSEEEHLCLILKGETRTSPFYTRQINTLLSWSISPDCCRFFCRCRLWFVEWHLFALPKQNEVFELLKSLTVLCDVSVCLFQHRACLWCCSRLLKMSCWTD